MWVTSQGKDFFINLYLSRVTRGLLLTDNNRLGLINTDYLQSHQLVHMKWGFQKYHTVNTLLLLFACNFVYLISVLIYFILISLTWRWLNPLFFWVKSRNHGGLKCKNEASTEMFWAADPLSHCLSSFHFWGVFSMSPCSSPENRHFCNITGENWTISEWNTTEISLCTPHTHPTPHWFGSYLELISSKTKVINLSRRKFIAWS